MGENKSLTSVEEAPNSFSLFTLASKEMGKILF